MQTQPRGLETNRQIDTCIREESKHWPILVSGKNKSIFGLARTIARKNGLKAAEARVAQRLKLLAKKKKIVLPDSIRIK
jgi:hypothetical protein